MILHFKLPPNYIYYPSIVLMSDYIVLVYPLKFFRIYRFKRLNCQLGPIIIPWCLAIRKMHLLHFRAHVLSCLRVSEVLSIFQKPLLILIKMIRFHQIYYNFIFINPGLKGEMGSMYTSYHVRALTGMLLLVFGVVLGIHHCELIFNFKNNIVIFY